MVSRLREVLEVRERTGFLFNIPEDQILFPRVLDDVSYGLIRKGVSPLEARKKALLVLEILGVDETAELSPYQLSHGQRQRIALAGALVTNPSLLLLDEPSSALDPPGRLSLAGILQKIDSSILLATHDIEFASRICSRFLVIKDRRSGYSSSGEISFKLRQFSFFRHCSIIGVGIGIGIGIEIFIEIDRFIHKNEIIIKGKDHRYQYSSIPIPIPALQKKASIAIKFVFNFGYYINGILPYARSSCIYFG